VWQFYGASRHGVFCLLNCRSDLRRRSDLPTEATSSEEELVERLYEAADAVEDEDVRDELYKAHGVLLVSL
jgi:hypothetical protein